MKEKKVILVVDDQIQNNELLEAYLIPQGYKVIKATNGEEALLKLSSNQTDLILLDVMMPGMDGFEILRRIRQDKKYRLLPIILVTALIETKDRVAGIEAGCDDFISKPVDKMELLARVRSLIKVKAYNDLLQNYRTELEFEVSKNTEAMKKTLQGSIKVLVDILELLNPEAFKTSQLSRKLTHNLCERLQITNPWEYEVAAMLSQIGLATLPHHILEKYSINQPFNKKEQSMFKSHPGITQQLICNIPKFGEIAEAIGYQRLEYYKTLEIKNKRVASMAHMLKLTLDFISEDKKSARDAMDILADFQNKNEVYDPEMLSALEAELTCTDKNFIIKVISPQDVVPGMILAEKIINEQEMLVVPKGTEMTEVLRMKLLNFLKIGRKISKIKVLVQIDKKI